MPEPTKEPLKQGKSWSLSGIKDTRENVIESVKAAAFVPDACKAMIVEAIEVFDPKVKLIRLDVHVQVVDTPRGQMHLFNLGIASL